MDDTRRQRSARVSGGKLVAAFCEFVGPDAQHHFLGRVGQQVQFDLLYYFSDQGKRTIVTERASILLLELFPHHQRQQQRELIFFRLTPEGKWYVLFGNVQHWCITVHLRWRQPVRTQHGV